MRWRKKCSLYVENLFNVDVSQLLGQLQQGGQVFLHGRHQRVELLRLGRHLPDAQFLGRLLRPLFFFAFFQDLLEDVEDGGDRAVVLIVFGRSGAADDGIDGFEGRIVRCLGGRGGGRGRRGRRSFSEPPKEPIL